MVQYEKQIVSHLLNLKENELNKSKFTRLFPLEFGV